MGKILLYKAGRACLALQSGASSFHTFKDVNGDDCWGLVYDTTQPATTLRKIVNDLKVYNDLTGYASEDTEEDFSLDHYSTREIANVSYSRTSATSTGGIVYTIQVTNDSSAEISVGSIKFTKTLDTANGGSLATSTCLLWGYFLDTPVTIGVGETKTFAINLDS